MRLLAAGPSPRYEKVVRRHGLLLALLLPGCEAGAPRAAAPAFPPGCWLEAAQAKHRDRTVPRDCGLVMPDGVCNDECKDAVRKCAIEKTRALKPFSISWTNSMRDGVLTRRAIEAKQGTVGYQVAWLEYEMAAGFDAQAGTLAKKSATVSLRWCTELDDLREVCDPRLAAPSARCGAPPLVMRENAFMHCEGTPPEPFCAEP